MSWKVSAWVMEHAPVKSPAEQALLYALADRAHDDGKCAWPSQKWLSKMTMMSDRTVRRHLAALEGRGVIVRGDQRVVQHLPKATRPVVWDLAVWLRRDPPDNMTAQGAHEPPDKMTGAVTIDRSPPDNGVRSPRTTVSDKPPMNHPYEPPITPHSPPEGDGRESAATAEPSEPDTFADFWQTYPRRVGKPKARAAYARAVKRAGGHGPVLDGARRFAADPNLPPAQYIPHPTTWLNRDGWEDEPLPARDAAPAGFGSAPEDWFQVARGPAAPADVLEGEVVTWPELGT